MKRIVIERPSCGDLADEFRKALDLICDHKHKSRSGTKLLSSYAAITVDDTTIGTGDCHSLLRVDESESGRENLLKRDRGTARIIRCETVPLNRESIPFQSLSPFTTVFGIFFQFGIISVVIHLANIGSSSGR
jgi:hypothetical protein